MVHEVSAMKPIDNIGAAFLPAILHPEERNSFNPTRLSLKQWLAGMAGCVGCIRHNNSDPGSIVERAGSYGRSPH
jgi:hypothetical protein